MKKILSILSIAGLAIGAQAADVVINTNVTTDTTWTADNDYLLPVPVYVTDGATLTIEPGTTIYGYQDVANGTFGSLVITRGSMIMAEGTSADPIVFTALQERDGVETSPSVFEPITLEDSGFWGGLIILGNAILNTENNPIANPDAPVVGTYDIEGFPAGTSDLITYGGDDDLDNSGVLRYVSIRFGGFEFQTNEEINGLTLGAVGSGTTIEFVEVFNNQDDGVEMFGGTVDLRYMVMAFNEDESFDWDQGYRGRGQFWFAIQKDVGAGSNYGAEMDGGDGDVKTYMPYSTPVIYNATYIGSGIDGANPQSNATLRMKDNTGGYYYNTIFTDFKDYAIRIDDADTEAQYTAGNIETGGIVWGSYGDYDGTNASSLTKNNSAFELGVLSGLDNSNTIGDPMLGGISRTTDGALDPRPSIDGPAYDSDSWIDYTDEWFYAVDYKGAFGQYNWMKNWTYLDQQGYMATSSEDLDSNTNFINLSTRATVGTGNGLIIGGLIVKGDEPKTVFVRGLGLSLVGGGITEDQVIKNPNLRVISHSLDAEYASNDNWRDDPFSDYIIGTIVEPDDELEAGVIFTVTQGAYTILLRGEDDTDVGIGSIEIYELE